MSAENRGRVFVDTHVLLYAFDTSAGERRERALALMGALWRQGNGCVSVQVLQEFYVNATRKLRVPLELEVARRIITSLFRWEVHTPTAEDMLRAIDLQGQDRLSFWDAMVLSSASKLGCSVLYSEDLNDTQIIAGVQVVNPSTRNGGDR